ncbi:unnamed protein product [Absidia cylindrospora]
MTKKKQQQQKLNNIRSEPADFKLEELDVFRFWGVCPGVNQVLVAVDGSDDDKAHEIREFSEMWDKKLTLSDFRTSDGASTLQQVVSSYPTLNTASSAKITLAVQARLASLSDVMSAQMKIKEQSWAIKEMGERFVNMFIGDGTGNGEQTFKNQVAASHGFSPVKLEPYARDQVPVVCLGDGRSSDKETRSLLKRCKDLLIKAECDGQLIFLEVDEYLTSQRCSGCFNLTLSDVQAANGVQRCQSCDKMWRREVNAARNLRSIVMHQIHNKTHSRPHNLERPHQ